MTAQEAAAISRRKSIYEALHPETKAEANASLARKSTDKMSFVSETAGATGKDERTVRRAAARGKALGDDLAAISGTSLDKGAELDALAKMKPAACLLDIARVQILSADCRLRNLYEPDTCTTGALIACVYEHNAAIRECTLNGDNRADARVRRPALYVLDADFRDARTRGEIGLLPSDKRPCGADLGGGYHVSNPCVAFLDHKQALPQFSAAAASSGLRLRPIVKPSNFRGFELSSAIGDRSDFLPLDC